MIRKLLFGLGIVSTLAAIVLVLILTLGSGTGGLFGLLGVSQRSIQVGLIHSQTGPLAISERSLLDAEILALEEINRRQLIPGHVVKWEKIDGRSDPAVFADQTRRLIEDHKVDLIVGGITAECRKAMLGPVESTDGLLIFPANFEGIEDASHIIYTGGTLNQTVMPAVRWCFDGLKAKRFYVLGSEELSSRVACEIAKDAIKAARGELVGESYLALTGGEIGKVVDVIKESKADVVLNFLVGDSNIGLYSSLKRSGVTPEKLPVVAFAIAEDELRRFPSSDVAGHYAAWSYFQSIDRKENAEFVRAFKARYGEDRVVSDWMVSAYNGIMLWAQTVRETGSSLPGVIRPHLGRQSLNAPEGIVTIDQGTLVAWRPFYLGKARPDGQFDIVWSITKPIEPELYVTTRSEQQWEKLLTDLKSQWSGRWSSSEAIHPNPTLSPK